MGLRSQDRQALNPWKFGFGRGGEDVGGRTGALGFVGLLGLELKYSECNPPV